MAFEDDIPYPGYSWSMTQHIGPATDRVTMYRFLQAANLFAESEFFGQKITEYLVENNLLTSNIREDAGKPQAWRDYQQVLSELGFIYSTKFTDKLFLTPIAMMWLDGSIGYSEVMTTQALRYQYPNGHKQDISSAVKRDLVKSGKKIPTTRTELDAIHGVCIKPVVLIFRILYQLYKEGDCNPHISTHECLHALVPTKTNADWREAFFRLKKLRKEGIGKSPSRPLRHVAEWFRFLNCTDIFIINKNFLSFSELAKKNLELLFSYCEEHELKDSFWLEITEKTKMSFTWFSHFGSPDLSKIWFKPNILKDYEYLSSNYIDGIDIDEDFNNKIDFNYNISLKEIDFDLSVTCNSEKIPKIDLKKIYSSQKKRSERTNLHHSIVKIAAKKLSSNGYGVFEDNKSVDLLAVKDEFEGIIEVKTVTPRNISTRLRLGVGQLSEYRYRRFDQTGNRPESILLLSSNFSIPRWYKEYLEKDANISLITYDEGTLFTNHTENGFIGKILDGAR